MGEPTELEKEAMRVTNLVLSKGRLGGEAYIIIFEALRFAYSKGCQDASMAAEDK